MIDTYTFGRMTIDGKQYAKDLIILPDGTILHPWWRQNGHRLTLDDLEAVINASPDILVVGTGMSGLMKLDAALYSELAKRNIDVTAQPTTRAVEKYNSLRKHNSGIAACFHLTC